MKLMDYELVIENFLKEKLKETHADGYILGLSGGIDSALVALIALRAVGKDKLLTVGMPIHSNPNDLNDARELALKFNLIFVEDDLSNAFDSFIGGRTFKDMAVGNTKVRLRMTNLYLRGQSLNYLVLGTDNLDERYLGYFTKWGDGACDILPISRLTKGEVYEMSRNLGVTDAILNKTPSAGLFTDQSDEKEMGVKYKDVDSFLLDHEIDSQSFATIARLHERSNHKREAIPEAPKYERD